MKARIGAGLLALSLGAVSGCGWLFSQKQLRPSPPEYVAAIPESSKLAVIPFNHYIDQQQFASQIEAQLVALGFSLVVPSEGAKQIEERKGASMDSSSNQTSARSTGGNLELQEVRIAKYLEAEGTPVDYFVYTIWTENLSGSVKVSRKSDRQVLGVVQIRARDPRELQPQLLSGLEKMRLIYKKGSVSVAPPPPLAQ
ncbi:MAG: hypothetical protein HZB55_18620 [Deltaproteobacteria bacterium]|nr:hypothetical protein [Deltaproteobacteria bacterium]